ncbi:hypothetical protein HYPSUDRAFT_203329 [Hypholoma sublateritium FD-334 SS-4]|uniref:F-box domain-containing protein n=1 Tax=Hypholoma sublateritium (strain FD-334 SS-4) TaxID=945553 RepID=A0A0D2PM08_HYPSF|nr:hypothetical protein HYPSUDRAFT_203329 [Hypholoma sublateritium FD-334 SS-4]
MGHVNDFPVEIISLIFRQTWELYQLDAPQGKKNPHCIFPFNAATVCALWLNVLKSQPQYWKCVTFDVANDPTPFLDTLGLYTGGDIDVRVVSSRIYSATESQEKCRVQKIFTHLQPYLSICGVIEFDLAFQSSLPSSADILTHRIPRLSSLSLHCKMHNCDDNSLEIKIDKDKVSRQGNFRDSIFPSLKRLSLTGYSFVELYQLGEGWAEIPMMSRPASTLHVSVKHFKCHKRGHWDNSGSRSLNALLKTIAFGSRYKLCELVLTDISIDYRPTTDHYPPDIPFTSVKFKDVSRNFLSAFFASFSADGRQLNTIRFEGCSIPHIPNCAWTQTSTLIIVRTSFRKAHSSSSRIEEPLDDSLYNAVSAFQPENLQLDSCEELNDAFFDWLCDELGDLPGWGLRNLSIKDCKGFTAHALCNFVRHRNAQSLDSEDDDLHPISGLSVEGGRNALLTKADAQWFRWAENNIDVDWTVSNAGELGENYLTNFHTLGE